MTDDSNKTAEQIGAEQRLKGMVDQKKAENQVAPNEPITTAEGVVVPKKEPDKK
jgi:hypothetical protein